MVPAAVLGPMRLTVTVAKPDDSGVVKVAALKTNWVDVAGVGVGVGVVPVGGTSLIVKIDGLLPTLPPKSTKFTVSGDSTFKSVKAGTVKLAVVCPAAKFNTPAAEV